MRSNDPWALLGRSRAGKVDGRERRERRDGREERDGRERQGGLERREKRQGQRQKGQKVF